MPMAKEARKYIQCNAVGDKGVGKTSLLLAYEKKRFPTEIDLIKAKCSSPYISVSVKCKSRTVDLVDTVTLETDTHMRPLFYKGAHIFLACFSVVLPSTLESLKMQWIPEIAFYCPETPYILVGTQIDLRDDSTMVEHLTENNLKPITSEEGRKLAKELEAVNTLNVQFLPKKGWRT
ncbi:Cell division control protein 42 like protein [Argiope bruennichi]|uniref:Cell division control protein 42 like protein n=1 Tax=Argiope bruennichi TaxID=94029 RepID=A0A8T0EH56_ARGBR|nr:Cell division control protein 42 like protein [Argiope bruennichi]